MDSKLATLLLIDGSSFIFRAFYALPELTSPSGKPTGATYGVINMLRQLQAKYQTSHIACVFDAPGKTFRDEIHPEYKATRQATPETLIPQFADIYAIVQALGIPMLVEPKVEADDVIGTLACKAKSAGYKVSIISCDKDFAQLVDDDITLVNTMKNETLDIDGVIDKFGVKPEQIVDYLALVGDKVDNVPGVLGCGPRTAISWLKTYHTLENIINHASDIKGVVGQNLQQAINWLATAKTLVTINTNVPLFVTLDDLQLKNSDNATLAKYFAVLGFKTWLKQLEAQQMTAVAENFQQQRQVVGNSKLAMQLLPLVMINSLQELAKIVQEIIANEQIISFLVIGDDYPQPKCLQFLAFATKQTAYITNIVTEDHSSEEDLFNFAVHDIEEKHSIYYEKYLGVIKQLLISDVAKICVNAKETIKLLQLVGLNIHNVSGDITLAHYLKNSRQKHNLRSIFLEYVNCSITDLPSINTTLNRDSIYLQSDHKLVISNLQQIISHTISLEELLISEFDQQELSLYREMELPLAHILVAIEMAGITLDIATFKVLGNELTTKLTDLTDRIYQEAHVVFNLNSPKQLQDVLFNQLKLPTTNVKKNVSGFSTDETTLNMLADDGVAIAKYMLEQRTLSKLLNTYVAKLPLLVDHEHKVHTTFEQALVASGRLSSRDPNLQNIPIRSDLGKRIREGFVASTGRQLICADYSQIELRILAEISKDDNLLAAFNNNCDIHTVTASEIFHKPLEQVSKDERRYAKTINFSLLYGKTAFGLAQELKLDRATAKQYIDTYFAKYPRVLACLEQIKTFARSHGYVATLFGRRIYLPNINAQNKIIREAEERLALNAPMQGTSADIIKFAMLKIAAWLKEKQLNSTIVLQVHDELILDVPENEVDIIRDNIATLMTTAVKLKVKMAVDVRVAPNWG